jgi:hypothetical protein
MTEETFQENYPYYNILNGIQERNDFNTLFFSRQNIDTIQTMIINEVFSKTGKAISPQKEVNLVIIMKGIYLRDGGKYPASKDKYRQEFDRLNRLVVKYSLERLEPVIKQQIDYIKDISNPLQVLDRPLSDTTYGTKTTRFNF